MHLQKFCLTFGVHFNFLWRFFAILAVKDYGKNFKKNIYRKMLDKLMKKLLLFYNVILCGFIAFFTGDTAS